MPYTSPGQNSRTGAGAREGMGKPAESVNTGEPAPMAWAQENGWADQLSFHPGPDQDSELAHPSYELLECVKGLVLQMQTCRTSMTQGGLLVRIQY